LQKEYLKKQGYSPEQQISQTDNSISEILKTIPKESLKNTVVILASDHGEAFGEHGILNHAATVFQEEIHIPLMMRIPNVAPKRVTEAVSLLDMAPTILSFMNITPPATFKGENLLPVVNGKTLGVRAIPSMNGYPYYFENIKKLPESLEVTGALGSEKKLINVSSVGIRIGQQRVFFMNPPPKVHTGLNWYNLEIDPKELNNLAEKGTLPPEELMNALNELKKELTTQ
jgi:arylsulfatase A-like enzyme